MDLGHSYYKQLLQVHGVESSKLHENYERAAWHRLVCREMMGGSKAGRSTTIVSLILGFLCGIVTISPTLWIFIVSHDKSSNRRLTTAYEEAEFSSSPHRALRSIGPIDPATMLDSQSDSNNALSENLESVRMAVLSTTKTLHTRGAAAYKSYGKSLRDNFQVYTFVDGAHDDSKRKTPEEFRVNYIEETRPSRLPNTDFIYLLAHVCNQVSTDHHMNTHFLMLLRDDTYVHLENLHSFIDSLLHMPTPPSYTGLRSQDRYCEIQNGILIHQAAIQKICNGLDFCLSRNRSESSEVGILGKCFHKTVGNECWSPKQVK